MPHNISRIGIKLRCIHIQNSQEGYRSVSYTDLPCDSTHQLKHISIFLASTRSHASKWTTMWPDMIASVFATLLSFLCWQCGHPNDIWSCGGPFFINIGEITQSNSAWKRFVALSHNFLSHMFSEYEQSLLLSCKLHHKARVLGKVPHVPFIPSVEENGAVAFPPILI